MEHLPAEQKICISCGFCCNGTLFDKAVLHPDEKKHLPETLRATCYTKEGRDFMKLPCPFFTNMCSIYASTRLEICSAFSCRLLTDLEKELMSADTAATIIVSAKSQLESLYEPAQVLFDPGEKVYFREIQERLKSIPEDTYDDRIKVLKFQCNIMEALLSRHFKHEDDFNSMVIYEHQNASAG